MSTEISACHKCPASKKFNKAVTLVCYLIGRKLATRNNFGDLQRQRENVGKCIKYIAFSFFLHLAEEL